MAFKPNKTLSGNEPSVVKEFPVATNTDLALGTVVKVSSGKVVKATTGDAMLGVTALRHDDAVDMFAHQSGTGNVSVYCDPNQCFECPIGESALSAISTANTVKITGTAEATSTVGGNVLYNGTLYPITAVSFGSGENSFTATGFPADVAATTKVKVIPPLGCTTGDLDSDAQYLTFADGKTSQFVVVDATNYKVLVKPILHVFGAEN